MNIVTFLEMAASADPGRVALGTGTTYADLLAATSRLAGQWAGAPPAVAYAAVGTPALPVALFAAAWTGRPFVPVSYRLADEPLRALLGGQAPAVLLAEGGPPRWPPPSTGCRSSPPMRPWPPPAKRRSPCRIPTCPACCCTPAAPPPPPRSPCYATGT
nr:hypothetical protein GCM10020093_006620 [Planobispora longispora]